MQNIKIDVSKKGIFINKILLANDATIDDLSKILNAIPRIVPPDYEAAKEQGYEPNALAFYDELGIWCFTTPEGRIKDINLLIERQKNTGKRLFPRELFNGEITFGGKAPLDAIKEKQLRDAYIYLDARIGEYQISLTLADAVRERIEKFSFAERLTKSETGEIDGIVRNAPVPISEICFYHDPKKSRAKPSDKYEIVRTNEPKLVFKNLNFKLAVMNELMYEGEILKPKFDVFEYCAERGKDAYDYYGAIPTVKKWFGEYEIAAKFADELTRIELDGGNEIYLQIAPDWDGEDGMFDIKSIDVSELAQFKNLKTIATTGINIGAKARKILAQNGIEVIDE